MSEIAQHICEDVPLLWVTVVCKVVFGYCDGFTDCADPVLYRLKMDQFLGIMSGVSVNVAVFTAVDLGIRAVIFD